MSLKFHIVYICIEEFGIFGDPKRLPALCVRARTEFLRYPLVTKGQECLRPKPNIELVKFQCKWYYLFIHFYSQATNTINLMESRNIWVEKRVHTKESESHRRRNLPFCGCCVR